MVDVPVQLALNLGIIVAGAAATFGVVRAQIRSLEARMKAAEQDNAETAKELAGFKLEAARTFVSAGALAKIEGQMEAGFNAIRQELRDTNATIVAAILNGQHPAAPRRRSPTDQ